MLIESVTMSNSFCHNLVEPLARSYAESAPLPSLVASNLRMPGFPVLKHSQSCGIDTANSELLVTTEINLECACLIDSRNASPANVQGQGSCTQIIVIKSIFRRSRAQSHW